MNSFCIQYRLPFNLKAWYLGYSIYGNAHLWNISNFFFLNYLIHVYRPLNPYALCHVFGLSRFKVFNCITWSHTSLHLVICELLKHDQREMREHRTFLDLGKKTKLKVCWNFINIKVNQLYIRLYFSKFTSLTYNQTEHTNRKLPKYVDTISTFTSWTFKVLSTNQHSTWCQHVLVHNGSKIIGTLNLIFHAIKLPGHHVYKWY